MKNLWLSLFREEQLGLTSILIGVLAAGILTMFLLIAAK